ncbi:MAG: hypothetical protein AAGA54_31675 [Myxococcota bacterium]
MPKRFVFFSWTYAFGTAMGLLFIASLITLGFVMGEMTFALVGLVPAAGCVYLARRTRVVVALDGDVLSVLPGLGPRTTVQLAAGTRLTSGAPYRSSVAREANRAQLDVVDHAAVDGPVIEENSTATRTVGRILRVLKFLLSDHGGGFMGPIVREDLGRLRVKTATGTLRTFVLPADGDANATRLEELCAALDPPK